MDEIHCCDTGADGENNSCRQQISEILKAAGLDSSQMDPSSAKFLGEMLGYKLQMEQGPATAETKKDVVPAAAAKVPSAAAGAKDSEQSDPKPGAPESATPVVAPVDSEKAKSPLPKSPQKPSLASRLRDRSVEAVPGKAIDTAAEKTVAVVPDPVRSTSSKAVTGVHLDAASRKLSSGAAGLGSSKMEATEEESSSSVLSALRAQLLEQQAATRDQSEVLRLLTDHIRELTDTVKTLQGSVDRLQGLPAQPPAHTGNQQPLTETSDRLSVAQAPADSNTSNINTSSSNNNNNSNNNTPNEINDNNNNIREAHLFAHNMAWRIATFPVRAILLYMKYEYRVVVVMYRLAKRDILNPFREAGVIFQLGFVLLVVYGRIAPWLEDLSNGHNGGSSNSEEYEDDADLQIETLVMCIIFGFLWHVGWFGLLYRFFFRDRVHFKIWRDLRNGVEMTPTYGLEWPEDNPDDDNDDDGDGDVGNNNEANNDDENGAAREGNQNNNNVPRRPNQNRGNIENDHGPVGEIANAIGNGVNNFFMGHLRRRRAAEAAEEAEHGAANGEDGNENDGNGNLNAILAVLSDNIILGFISDILCLFYSFFVSILPSWNYEQQLRDIRDEHDRRLRQRMEQEAEALRNQQQQHADGEIEVEQHVDDGNNNNDASDSESESSESDSESESDE